MSSHSADMSSNSCPKTVSCEDIGFLVIPPSGLNSRHNQKAFPYIHIVEELTGDFSHYSHGCISTFSLWVSDPFGAYSHARGDCAPF